jgi:hypothetical protein
MLRDPWIVVFEDTDVYATERREEHRLFVRLKGWVFHSSLHVKTQGIETEGDTIIFIARMGGPREPLPPDVQGDKLHMVDYEIEVPETISAIRFGPGGPIVWQRGVGPLRPPRTPSS